MKYLLLAIAALALTACGGSDSKDSTVSDPGNSQGENEVVVSCSPASESQRPGSVASAAGVYVGVMRVRDRDYDAFMLVDLSGRAMMTHIGLVGLSGFLQATESQQTSWRFWLDLDGGWAQEMSIIRQPGARIAGMDTDFNGNIQFDMSYVTPDVPACLGNTDVTGSWTGTSLSSDNSGPITTTITINEEGRFTGSDTIGCILDGQISGYNVEGGILVIQMEMQNCSQAGQFSGLGSLVANNDGSADLIGVIIESGDYSRVAILGR